MRQRSYVNGGYGFQGINPEGGVMNMALKLMVPPVGEMDAVNKEYVDANSTGFDAANITGSFSTDRLPAWTGTDISSSGNGVFTLSPTGVTPGTYTKVTVDSKGRVTGGGSLTASDIPVLNWSKLTDKPTTLAGYGITDVVSLSGGVMTGPLVLTQAPSADNQLANKAYVDSKISTSAASPYVTGDVVYKGTPVTPAGYLRCNGGEVSKTTYANLYAIVGDKYSFGNTQAGSGQPWRQQYDINTTQSTDITSWTTSTSLPATVGRSQAIVTKNRVYLLGGVINDSYSSTVYTAPINLDGTLGAWTTSTALPAAVQHSQAIVTKNRVYLLGGYIGGGYSSTVYTAPINLDGTLGTWTTSTALPATVAFSQAIVTKNRVYLLGGVINNAYSSTVHTAPINLDGTLGAWTTSTSLPGIVYASQSIVTKNRVYLLGGAINDSYVPTVYTAPINLDGTLGAWTTSTSLPGTVGMSQSIVTKNRVYLLGGYVNSVISSTVYTAPINLDGTLGAWTTSTSLPGIVGMPQAIVTKNRVYLLGGLTNGSFSSTVYTAPISGGLNDYSPYYDGTITYTSETNFNLPDLTSKDKPGAYSYIKY